jgi:hypothetical protein
MMKHGGVRRALAMMLSTALLTACQGGGFGVPDADTKARETQQKAAPAAGTGFSVWSMFASSKEAVRKRLEPGLGKPKAELIKTFGEPFQCNQQTRGGETCGWYDGGLAEGGSSDARQHRVYYTFDQTGLAHDWDYDGIYGKLNSREATLPTPPPSSTTP